jgi:hypothetical protein
VQHNAPSLAVLRSLNDGKTITIPEATGDGRPAHVAWEPESPGRHPVAVRIHYLVGNHDWFFHLPGPDYDAIRRTVVEAIGAVTPATTPFPHDPDESAAIRRIYESHHVFARHGDIFDAYNFEGDRNRSSLGDAVVVELVDRFGFDVQAQLGGMLPPATLAGLREIDNLRPTAIIPAWIDALLTQTCPDALLRRRVKDLWNDLADRFRRLDFVRQHHAGLHLFDRADQLGIGLRISVGVLRGSLTRFYAWLLEKFGGAEGSYASYAAREPAFTSRAARSIVYGHTHRYELVPLASTAQASGRSLDQVYINSGTWRPYHELARARPADQQFVGYQVMTYLAFFKDGERGGRHFESWSGVLGPEQHS